MQPINNSFIISLLVSSRWRVARHLILLALTASVSTGFVWFAQEQGQLMSMYEKYGKLLFFTALFLGGCYLNIYLLVPRLLVKNRWGAYFGSLLGIALPIIVVAILIQTVAEESIDNPFEVVDYFVMVVNLMSATLSIFLLFAGTTTFVLFKYWIQDKQQSEELESATLQLELKLLENQINPHFLFNMLNNANIMIKKDPDVALHIIGKLEEMLRYQLKGGTQEKVYLADEMVFLTDLLEMEKTRRDYFSYTISKEGEVDNVQIPPLLFITFVENAVKHNQDSRTSSYVDISFTINREKLIFVCKNSIPQRPSNKEVGGIGLANIKRRLNLLFKDNYWLEQTKTDTSYTVKLELKL